MATRVWFYDVDAPNDIARRRAFTFNARGETDDETIDVVPARGEEVRLSLAGGAEEPTLWAVVRKVHEPAIKTVRVFLKRTGG